MAVMGRNNRRNGRTVLVRTASPGDGPDIARLLTRAATGVVPGPLPRRARRRRQVAASSRVDQAPGAVCIVAALPGEPRHLVAEARYVPTGGDVAELAVTVLDRYQRSGLGKVMLEALIDQARDASIERLRAVVSLANGAMLRLLAGYGRTLAEPTDECGVACLEISSTGGMPGWPEDVTGQRMPGRAEELVRRRPDSRAAGGRAVVRLCGGPDRRAGRPCHLITGGECRLAAAANRIIARLPATDQRGAAVTEAHRRMWPGKLPS